MSSTELMKHAEHCGAFSKPQLNHTGLLNAAFCSTSRCFRSSLNAGSAVVGREVLLLARPLGDGVDDAADQLLDRALALRRADVAAEIFRDDDVGRLLRPGLRDLDLALFEDNAALFVADDGIAQFPFDLVERVDAGRREEPRELEAGGGLRLAAACRLRRIRCCPLMNSLSVRPARPTDPSEKRLHACFFLRIATPLPMGQSPYQIIRLLMVGLLRAV